MNNKICEALLDTGSEYTLIKASAARRLEVQLNERHNPPRLHGVTGSPLRILGMAKASFKVGDKKECHRWVPVVPDTYLTCDMLLGCDLISEAPLTWDGKTRTLSWGETVYVVNYIPYHKRMVSRVRDIPIEPIQTTGSLNINLGSPMYVEPYHTKFVPLPSKENPGQTLLVHPQPTIIGHANPFLVQVQEDGQVHIPFLNPTKARKLYPVGTLIGSYEKVPEFCSSKINTSHEVHNDLIPVGDAVEGDGTRQERLNILIKDQEWDHLSQSQRTELNDVILHHDQLFILGPQEVGTMDVPPVHINVTDPQPCRGPVYRYPELAKSHIADLLKEMEQKHIIERSQAAWLSPIVLVNKPDGSKRMCLDYRGVNKHLATDVYPLPRLDELVEQAAGHKYYCTLDLKDAYFQVPLDEASRDLTTFTDGVALYRFTRLPFGLSCSPSLFSKSISSILSPLVQEGWLKNYLDDLILWAPSFEELLVRLEKLFGLLMEKGIKLNLSKCSFGLKQITFLGHLISENGIRPDPKNLEAIEKMQPPRNVKEVRRFLGMCAFYRKHVPSFAKIATPLTNLTSSKVNFKWTDECQKSFNHLKSCLMESPILASVQLDQPFFLTTDASDTHVGAVLSQYQCDNTNKPVGYFSRKLKPCEKKYSATDKEVLGVVLACRNFHHYLWGTHFTIITDHQPLTSVFKKKTKSPRMNRWILEMREYDYDINYIKGKFNVVADQLSRPVRVMVSAPEEKILGVSPQELSELQRKEKVWADMIAYLKGDKLPNKLSPKVALDQFIYQDELLYFVKENKIDGRLMYTLVIPACLRKEAMLLSHQLSGHLGQKKSILKAEELFYWPNLKVDLCNFVKSCPTCQRFKQSSSLNTQFRELPPVSKPLERIGIDLTDMVGGSESKRYVLTTIDHYSRYVKFYPLPNKHSINVIKALQEYIGDFGSPKGIVLDNGGEFREFCNQQQITLYYTTPYHPQGNGITERMHRTLKSILATLCKGHPLRWPYLLRPCQSIMNRAVHTSLGTTPFYAFFTRHPARVVGTSLPSIEGDDQDHEAAHKLILQTQQAQTRKYRQKTNQKRKNQAVKENDLVLVRCESTIPGTSRKLNQKWKGPFRVIEVRHGGSTYIVENTFNGQRFQRAAEQLKPFNGVDGWIVEPVEEMTEIEEPPELPPRERRRPRRLIEEM